MNTSRKLTTYKKKENRYPKNDWLELYPKHIIDLLRKHKIYPKHKPKRSKVSINDPNVRFTDFNYQIKPEDKLICMGEEVPMFNLGLIALWDSRGQVQPTLNLVFRHFQTGEMYEIVADYNSYVDGDFTIYYRDVDEVTVKKVAENEIDLINNYLIVDEFYKLAYRKFKLHNLLN